MYIAALQHAPRVASGEEDSSQLDCERAEHSLPCLPIMGYRQGVRHRTLTPAFAGSNPASPVKDH